MYQRLYGQMFHSIKIFHRFEYRKGDWSYNKLMDDFVKLDLMILDDFGMKKLDAGLQRDMLEIIKERYYYMRTALILHSQSLSQ